MAEMIQTKLMVEMKPAKFLSLGFGNIAHSKADLVCVSSFREARFVSNSSIGAIDRALGRGTLHRLVDAEDDGREACTLVDVGDANTSFRKVLVVWMGTVEEFWERESSEEPIQAGLQSAIGKIRGLGSPAQLDVTAMGSQYGGLHRRRIFDHLISWAAELFEHCPKVNHVRLVAYDLDTFVDFFEALYRLKGWTAKQVSLGSNIESSFYGPFEPEVASATRLLDQNPKQVLVICRTIVEQVINRLCNKCLGQRPDNLFGGIQALYERKEIPPQINSFLHTCRVVGNFAAHPESWEGEFKPSRRDAEVVMLLTLRVVEWFLGDTEERPKRN